MSMQTIPESAPETSVEPTKPRLERAAEQPKRTGSTEALVDAAMDVLTEPPANDNAAARGKQEREEPEEAERDPSLREGEEAVDEAGEPEEPEGAHADEDTRGTEAEPFKVTDLPSDKFIEVKIDGEKQVIPLSELASGYIREKTFSRRLNESKALTDRAQQIVEAAQQFPERLREQFRAWTQDPNEVLQFFLESEDREQVLEKVAEHYARMRIAHREKPELRLAFQRDREMRKIQAERERLEQQKRAEHEAREAAAQRERALAVWTPGWNEGLRRAGFPQVTPQLQEEVMVRCQQRIRSGHLVTSDDISEFVVRAAKLLELPRAGDKKPKPAPVAPKREPAPARKNGTSWDKVPRHQKVRSADFFLSGLKPRDYR